MSSVIIVGNGTSIIKKKNGLKIDSFDVVVRFNSFKIIEKFTGKKTSHWFTVNTNHIGESFTKIHTHSWSFNKEECKIYKELSEVSFCTKTTKKDVLDTGLNFPSTGLIAIFKYIARYGFVTITGFDWWDTENHHYADNEKRGSLHDPTKEKEIIMGLISQGKVFFLK
jgi:hypothetical protein